MPISGKEMLKRYLQNGWVIIRKKGSHYILRKRDKTEVIPIHGNEDLKKRPRKETSQNAT